MQLRLTLSEAQAEKHPDWETRELRIEVAGTVELVYHTLRDSSTSNVLATFDPEQGLWLAEQDGLAYSDIVIYNATAEEIAITELVAFAEEQGLAEDGLDEHVHDVASREGSAVNNEGLHGQISYLVAEVGPSETRRMIEEQCGSAPASGTAPDTSAEQERGQ
jgi:hypothetical protein